MIYFDGILYSWQKGGGVYRYFQKVIEAMASRGIDATFIAEQPDFGTLPKGDKHLHIERIGSITKPITKLSISLARKVLAPLNKMLLEGYFKNIPSGIFHSTYFTTYGSLRIPQVLTVHDMTYEKFPALFSDAGSQRFIKRKKLCIEKADAIICVSESTKKSLQEMFSLPEEKINVIYHGVDDYFNPDYDRKLAGHLISEHALSRPFILFVGNRAKYKNFAFFLKAFASWKRNPDYDIVVLGGGVFTPDEKKLITELGLTKQMKPLGYVSEEELKTFYCLSKAFIFPSLDEGFGLPILEAICSGARVLASDIPVFREIGYNIPLFFNPKDAASLSRALEELSNLPALTSAEKTAQAKVIRNAFSWEKCFDEHVAVYRKYMK